MSEVSGLSVIRRRFRAALPHQLDGGMGPGKADLPLYVERVDALEAECDVLASNLRGAVAALEEIAGVAREHDTVGGTISAPWVHGVAKRALDRLGGQ